MPTHTPPQPPSNTRIGFHYFPDEAHFRESDLQAWLPELKALGASWLTVVGSLTRAIPEAFIRGLVEAGIEPIIHLPANPIRRLDTAVLHPLLQAYARWGVHYLAIFSEPNSRASWAASDWGKPALVERALDAILPNLQLQNDLGLVPVFPPLKPGGDYWDTAFLDAALEGLSRRSGGSLLDRMAFGFFGFAGNRPADWGAGGPDQWQNTRPYVTPPGSQDHIGFRIGEWYDAAIRSRLGASRPLVCFAGGAVLGDRGDGSYPAVDMARHERCNIDIVDAMQSGKLPEAVLNLNYWLLAADASDPVANEAWYRPDGTTVDAADSLKSRHAGWAGKGHRAHAASAKTMFPDATAPFNAGTSGKAIFHYILLPIYEFGVSDWHWSVIFEYVRTFRPACGFSAQEAGNAQHVTIVGNEQGVSGDVEQMLAKSGCRVERIAGPDGDAIRARLTHLANAGQRFATAP